MAGLVYRDDGAELLSIISTGDIDLSREWQNMASFCYLSLTGMIMYNYVASLREVSYKLTRNLHTVFLDKTPPMQQSD